MPQSNSKCTLFFVFDTLFSMPCMSALPSRNLSLIQRAFSPCVYKYRDKFKLTLGSHEYDESTLTLYHQGCVWPSIAVSVEKMLIYHISDLNTHKTKLKASNNVP